MSKKILLLNPGSPDVTMRGLVRERPSKIGYCWPSIDMVICSGILNKEHYDLTYIDASVDRLSAQDVCKKIKEESIEAIVSLYTRYLHDNDIDFLKTLKEVNPHIPIVILPDIQFVMDPSKAKEFLEKHLCLDVVVMSLTNNDLDKYLDGQIFPDLKNICYRLKGQVVVGNSEVISQNGYSLPIPRHDLFKNKKYFLPQSRGLGITTTVMQFGCPYQCDFCIDKEAYPRSWCRDPQNVCEEFQYIEAQGFKEVYIRDLTFGQNRSMTKQFCELLIANKVNLRWVCTSRVDVLDYEMLKLMKEAGCMCIEFGVESGSDAIKEKHKKNITNQQIVETFSRCKELKIEIAAFLMIGFPEESLEDIKNSMDFCKALKPEFLVLNIANILPGTEFEEENRGKLSLGDKDDIWDSVSYENAERFFHPEISEKEINAIYKKELIRFYTHPSFIIKRLMKLRSLGALLRITQMGIGLISSVLSRRGS